MVEALVPVRVSRLGTPLSSSSITSVLSVVRGIIFFASSPSSKKSFHLVVSIVAAKRNVRFDT